MIGEKIRALRKERGLTLEQLSELCGMSIQQIHRLERANGRVTLEAIEQVCRGFGIDPILMLRSSKSVPVLGIVDENIFVHSPSPNLPTTVPGPFLGVDVSRLGAYLWMPNQRISIMSGHRIYFCRDLEGIDPAAWGHRSIITLRDGSRRMGWLIEQGGQVHVGQPQGMFELDVEVVWASKVLGVLPPDQEW